jgi:hypothetical protein
MIESSDLQNWVNIFIEYIDEQNNDQKYHIWMSYLLELFMLRRDLDTYINLFKDLDKIETNFSIYEILTPNNQYLSGSDWKFLPVNRTFKIGASLIIRELLRNNILKENKNIIEHAFMPKTIVQEIVFQNASNERTSRDIYSEIKKQLGIMEEFTFSGYYDIPILIGRKLNNECLS